MSWIKKQWNKLFSTIDDENEYEYEQAHEVEEEKQQRPPEQMRNQSRSSFRFPLIADEEIGVNSINNKEKHEHATKEKLPPLDVPNYYMNDQPMSSRVYDVEVSGIGELLAQRRGGTSKQKIERATQVSRRQPTSPLSHRERPKKSIKKEEKPTFTRETINPLENRKRFVPTEVPSPVYGFAKPSSIQSLLKKDTDEKTTDIIDENSKEKITYEQQELVYEDIQRVTEEAASTAEPIEEIEQQPLEKQPNQLEELASERVGEQNEIEEIESETAILVDEVVESVTQTEEDTPISLVEQETVLEEKLEEVEEDNPVENSAEEQRFTEEVNQIEFEHTLGNENDDFSTNEQQDHEEPVAKKRGSIPFNVIMLKSDKEKLLEKMTTLQSSRNKEINTEQSIEQKELPPTQIATLLERAGEPENIKPQDEEHNREDSNVTIENNESTDVTREESIEHLILESEKIEELEQLHEEQQQTTLPPLPQKQYVKPLPEYLAPPEENLIDKEWMESQAEVLVESLSHFQVTANVESIIQGPAVTQFEITVGQGTKVSKIRNLSDDLKLALAAKDIRIQAPIPGKSTIGIEIPNRISRAVQLSEITSSESFIQSESPLEAALGLDLTGKPMTIDLRKMPHGMIAGATGSGKSVCINSILVSLLYKADPQQLKLLLIDPKMVELAPFNHIPHLVSPVITDVKAATAALKWAVDEMERRYQLFAHVGVRDLSRFNKLAEQNEEYGHKLPYILIVIDELADLMMMSPADVEEAICRIAQKARACGIHLIIATQRPSVDVITGLIKSNIPTRIAFAVSSQVDSRTILDQQGAERLLGRGDMLYLGNGMSAPIRIQGTFVTDDEIEQIVDHVRQQGEPDYLFEQEELLKKAEMVEEYDELFEEVCRFAYEQGSASTSSIQRKFHIGYNRAARLVDMLESHGFVSESKGSKPRDVFITDSDLVDIFG